MPNSRLSFGYQRVIEISCTLGLAAVATIGCSSSTDSSVFDGGGVPTPGDDASVGALDGSISLDDGGIPPPGSCVRLGCQQVTCDAGVTTTVSGTVYDPAGKVPLYNVIVYVPNAPVGPLSSTGAVCDKCGAPVSGSPLVTAITDSSGHFALANVPAGQNIPLVMQVGKWRRQVTIPSVVACTETKLTDRNVTRLPKNSYEGEIPHIAITTGGADPLECLPRKIGLDDSEFASAGGAGHVHLYAGGGYTDAKNVVHNAANRFAPNVNGGVAFGAAQTFWSDKLLLGAYDIVLMACEGQPDESTKPVGARAALYAYENAGGRVFASHWQRFWFSDGPAPVPSVATWMDRQDPAPPAPASVIGNVDTSFPKGVALRDWLVNVKASTVPGQLPIVDSKHNVDAVNSATSQSWISLPNANASNQNSVQYMTFNTPINAAPADQCGRVVYSDLHVSSGDVVGQPFPNGCVTTDLTPQEKALEFMLFDLSSCILSDAQPPIPPPR